MSLKRYPVILWLACLLVSGLLAAAQIWMAHQRLELAGRHAVIQREARALHADINRLTLEFATLIRPERLRRLAVSELGMHSPSPMQVIHP